jgi:uncharacterized protein (DUF1800 family)
MVALTEREKIGHLLRRFGLGASETELDGLSKVGLDAAIDRLLSYESVDEGIEINPATLRLDANKPLNMPLLVTWWVARLLTTRRPLQEKMTVFWHDHFATSAVKVKVSGLMHQQNETLRANATGNFRTLLHAASQDPAMIFWLDNQQNVAGKPNENFAREVMELFTLGIGHYTEKDVQEAARAFTGWSVNRGKKPASADQLATGAFINRSRFHDPTEKTVLGLTGRLDGDQVLNHLCDMPQTAETITTKLIQWFVMPSPEDGYVARMTRVFRDEKLEIKPLLRAIMKSPEFYSEEAVRSIAKSPVDFVIPTMRQLGIGTLIRERVAAAADDDAAAKSAKVRRALSPAYLAQDAMRAMGMYLMFPPDVAGWDGGTAWITSATMVERIGFADQIFGVSKKRKLAVRYPAAELFGTRPSAHEVVERLSSIFNVSFPADRTRVLESAAAKGIAGGSASELAASVSRLIFASPEFQFC